MTEQELQEIEGRVREHTGLVYRADLATLIEAGSENVRLQDELDGVTTHLIEAQAENRRLHAENERLQGLCDARDAKIDRMTDDLNEALTVLQDRPLSSDLAAAVPSAMEGEKK